MGFCEIGLTADDARTAIQQSVALADQARREYLHTEIAAHRKPRPIWIAGSLGAYGAALHNGAEFHGRYGIGHAELVAFHAERIDAMRDTDADFLAFETIPSLGEGEAVVEALARYPNLAAYISFTCRDGSHTGHGEPIDECARLLDPAANIIAIGINCTAPQYILPLIEQIRAVSTANASPSTPTPARPGSRRLEAGQAAPTRKASASWQRPGAKPAPTGSGVVAAPARNTSARLRRQSNPELLFHKNAWRSSTTLSRHIESY